ncbi:MAG: D-alanyl-D-alanine carboxypeptidase/D-alanyl-D-alanine-endopeptidase, partial [Gemmatimonadota bacterium]|nr:D-alanyl-D-alanine carboxypeptidase/D-alanyl-D-alanine-endopeptidase [Gemmatimonadota bacterium]
MKRTAAALLVAVAAACAPAAPSRAPAPARTASPTAALRASLDSLFADTLFAHAHWGVHVRSLDRGDTLFQLNDRRMFVPASNVKLLTGAAALETLGPDFRFRTRVAATGPVRDGVLRGDLVVRGGGDPTISGRFHPDPRAVFRAWADSLASRGVRRITGRIVGVDSVFDNVPLGRGWAWDDLDAPYSAEISGLLFNEGALTVRALPDPGAPGGVRVATDPPTGYVPIDAAATRAAREAAPRLSATRALGAA